MSNRTTPGTAWNRARYSFYAPFYDAIVAPFQGGRRRSIELLAPQPGEGILVVGCGTGLDLPLLPPSVQVTAFDLTPAMVRRTAARADRLGRLVPVSVMNGERLAFADASFDAVLLQLILAVIPDPVACIQEVARVLRPGGRVAIFDKWLPDDTQPSAARRAVNAVASVAFSDLNRQLGPLLAAARLALRHREPAGLAGAYQVALASKQD